MASVKLTNSLRSTITNNATNNAFVKELDALDAREKALGDKLYRLVVSEETEKLVKKLPTGFMKTQDYFNAYLYRDGQAEADGRTNRRVIHFSSERRIPAYTDTHWAFGLVCGQKLIDAHDAIENEREALKTKREELRRSVSAVLASVTTVAKLIEVWPESLKFIPEEAIKGETRLFPALQLDALNASLVEAGVELAVAA